jgi:hypothetical protein
LPTHVASFIPPPSEQALRSTPWRGSLVISDQRSPDRTTQSIWITVTEVEGDSQLDSWPAHLFVNMTHFRPLLREVITWTEQHNVPTCVFMADRLRDPNETLTNQANFRSFVDILKQRSMVAIVSWNSERVPGAGIVVYPAPDTGALLHCSVFVHSPFPDFLSCSSLSSRNTTALPSVFAPRPFSIASPQQLESSASPYSVPKTPSFPFPMKREDSAP